MTKVSKLAQSAAPENLAELQKSGLEAVTTLNTAMAENVSRFYGEWMQFLSHRLRENVRVQQKILTCGSLEEARALQEDFLRRAMDEYSDESEKFVRMFQDATARALDSMKS
ncbi:MAG: phasin family protein [Rhodobacteraceae bacterium]|nr:phasin family protein [Paracoccaceae bacterium]